MDTVLRRRLLTLGGIAALMAASTELYINSRNNYQDKASNIEELVEYDKVETLVKSPITIKHALEVEKENPEKWNEYQELVSQYNVIRDDPKIIPYLKLRDDYNAKVGKLDNYACLTLLLGVFMFGATLGSYLISDARIARKNANEFNINNL